VHLGVEDRAQTERLLAAEGDGSGREVSAVVVGLSADDSLLRIATYLAERYEVPLSVVELQAFTVAPGAVLIVREETGADASPTASPARQSASLDDRWRAVRASAEQRGFGDAVDAFARSVQQAGLYARPYTRSILVTPPECRTRFLAVVGFTGSGSSPRASLQFGVDAFQEFFPTVSQSTIQDMLGEQRQSLDLAGVEHFGHALEALINQQPTSAPPA